MFLVEFTAVDFFVSLIYILILMFISYRIKTLVSNSYTKKFFIPFILFKIISAFFFVVIHSYVYRGGDTFLYFAGARFILDQIANSPERTFIFLFGDFSSFTNLAYSPLSKVVYSFKDPSTILMCQITSLFAFLGFKQFLATNILLSFFSALGIWHLFNSLCKLYPNKSKLFAIAILFIPSVGIWGSGILKDTITLGSIGLIFGGTWDLINRRRIVFSVLLILLGSLLCIKLKPYILYTFIPALLLWFQSRLSNQIENKAIRYGVTPLLIIIISAGSFAALSTVSDNAGKYSLENVEGVAKGFQSWHTQLAITDNQSGYSLGEFEFNAQGILSKAPEAFFVTYFRPTPFELRNAANLFESVQATSLLLFTIYLLFYRGPLNFFKKVIGNKDVRAFMLFAVTMGVAVGLTSYNFGALSRYKIPCLVFYVAALMIIYEPRKNRQLDQ